ncbi:MAG: hypothetical protein IPM50_02580 [Acidobacteriota bacterium]|nr:MAG: hypothetical protein IPM50_02580 [Acidobacteriota bacterium]
MTESEKIDRVLELLVSGSLYMCEFYRVEWSTESGEAGPIDHYAHAAYSRFSPFADVKLYTNGDHVLPRVIGDPNDPFQEFELQSDIRTNELQFTFDDIDGFISERFKTYKGAAKLTIYNYYPQVDLCRTVWWGTLHSPEVNTVRVVRAAASHGWHPRTLIVPSPDHGAYCPATFGRLLTDPYAHSSGLCPVNDHLDGGTIGAGDDEFCPRMTVGQCNSRCGTTNGRYFGGWDIQPLPYMSDPRGFMARAISNLSRLQQSLRVIAGRKHVSSVILLALTKEPNPNHPDQGFLRTLWEVCIGPVAQITNVRVNGQTPNPNQWAVALGQRGQSRLNFLGLTNNFSKTAHFWALNGLGNPAQFTHSNVRGECDVIGFNEVGIWSNATTYVRAWTDNIVWWLLEFYTNQHFGAKQDVGLFRIQKFIDASLWSQHYVTLNHEFEDGETLSLTHRRASFNAIVEGQPFDELIANICRAARIPPPFQDGDKYSVEPLREWTEDELEDAVVFTDHGAGRNIVWDSGEPSVSFSSIPPEKLSNKIKVTFEDGAKDDVARPFTIEDTRHQLIAGQARGAASQVANPLQMPAFGINSENQAIKFGFGIMWFGELDSGGTRNNSRAVFFTTPQHALRLTRYATPLKFDLELANGRESDTGEPFEYYRPMKLERVGGNRVRITAQAYNAAAMAAFETDAAEPPPPPPIPPPVPPPIPPPELPGPIILVDGVAIASGGRIKVPLGIA